MYRDSYGQEKIDPTVQGVVGISCAGLIVPWIVTWYLFKSGAGLDSQHCYVTEGELYVSSFPTGAATE